MTIGVMERHDQARRAARLRELHEQPPLVLPNAWDAASARVIEDAGATAIATTSAGVAWTHGFRDGQLLAAEQMLRTIEAVVATVDVPVTADVESGYGDGSPAAVTALVARLLDIGVAGVNIEDSPGSDGSPLRTIDAQAELLVAARIAAGPELVINARTDGYLLGVGDPATRFADTVARGQAYLAAGADVVRARHGRSRHDPRARRRHPGAAQRHGPTGAPTVAELAELGVTRISVGPAITVAAYDLVGRAAREMLEKGTWTTLDSALGFGELNGLFRG